MSKHRNPIANLKDRRALVPIIRDGGYEIVHVHRRNDHIVGGRAARRVTPSVKIVRTLYDADPPEGKEFPMLIRRFTDGIIAVSPLVASKLAGSGPTVAHIPAGVDTQVFREGMPGDSLRTELGIPSTSVVAGIVARMQPHRRFEVLLPAIGAAHREFPGLRAVIFGRGTRREEVAIRPVREMGLSDVILFAGYRDRDYVESLAAIDFLIFLVPGSDGSCRAVLQAMAMGRPVLAARRGILPEIVADGVTGRVVDDAEESLTRAILEMARDGEGRRRMGEEAARTARDEFSLGVQADRVIAFYQALRSSA
jgi:glycosyltransferase involved in cell wall biosynthesis